MGRSRQRPALRVAWGVRAGVRWSGRSPARAQRPVVGPTLGGGGCPTSTGCCLRHWRAHPPRGTTPRGGGVGLKAGHLMAFSKSFPVLCARAHAQTLVGLGSLGGVRSRGEAQCPNPSLTSQPGWVARVLLICDLLLSVIQNLCGPIVHFSLQKNIDTDNVIQFCNYFVIICRNL